MKTILIEHPTNSCEIIYDKECLEKKNKLCLNCEMLYFDESDEIMMLLERAGYEVEDICEIYYVNNKYYQLRIWTVEVSGRKKKQPNLKILDNLPESCHYDSLEYS